MHNQRTEYGKALVELGKHNPNVVVLEADLGKSTMSCMFEAEFPERYYEMGIAEQNMTSFAGGLALAGKTAFTNTFAVFAAGRAYDQIRQSIGTAGLNVKIVGSSAGFSDFGDGATHQAIDDVAIMNAVPGMTVFTPCDGIEIRKVVEAAAALDGPAYIRLCRNDLEDIFPEDLPYEIGKPVVLSEGTDVVIFSHGVMTGQALKAAEAAKKEGISVCVAHIPTVKPLQEAAVKELAEGKKGVVVCEEASIYGGLTSIICYLLRGMLIPVRSAAVMDAYGQSASSHEELLKYYGLDAEAVLREIKAVMDEVPQKGGI